MVRTNYLICYDITEDDTRFAVADICKDYGLERIQYSVFYGKLSRSHLKEIRLEIKETIPKTNSDVHIIQVCASCESNHEMLASLNLKDEEEIDNVQKATDKEKEESEKSQQSESDDEDDEEKQEKTSETIHTNYEEVSEEIPYDEGVIML